MKIPRKEEIRLLSIGALFEDSDMGKVLNQFYKLYYDINIAEKMGSK